MFSQLLDIEKKGTCRFGNRNSINTLHLKALRLHLLIELISIQIKPILMVEEEEVTGKLLDETTQLRCVCYDAVKEIIVSDCVELETNVHEVDVRSIMRNL
jgi:hypothetical protein